MNKQPQIDNTGLPGTNLTEEILETLKKKLEDNNILVSQIYPINPEDFVRFSANDILALLEEIVVSHVCDKNIWTYKNDEDMFKCQDYNSAEKELNEILKPWVEKWVVSNCVVLDSVEVIDD